MGSLSVFTKTICLLPSLVSFILLSTEPYVLISLCHLLVSVILYTLGKKGVLLILKKKKNLSNFFLIIFQIKQYQCIVSSAMLTFSLTIAILILLQKGAGLLGFANVLYSFLS